MRGHWPIRVKVFICLGLLLLAVAILSGAGLYASSAYRNLTRAMRTRGDGLDVAVRLSRTVSELRISVARLREYRAFGSPFPEGGSPSDHVGMRRYEFQLGLDAVSKELELYRGYLEEKIRTGSRMAHKQKEWQTVDEIDRTLSQIRKAKQNEDWMFQLAKIDTLQTELDHLQGLVEQLPSYLRNKLQDLPEESRAQYRTLIVVSATAATVAAMILLLLVKLFYDWVFRPLQTLVAGSRRVAGGEFDFRIHLDTQDEMAELADAMNHMTSRFQTISDDLENQVEERTRQVIRSEQLASVGFLAAGVAHEINNPLASIALCAESLESRIGEALDHDEQQQAVIANYLQMIQKEAFRCKGITEKLLDFSRTGTVQRQNTDLGQLIQDVIDMLGHLGKYRNKRVEFVRVGDVIASVNAQEIKQVVLNLLTNALDSFDGDGDVQIELVENQGFAQLTVTDQGCGMEPDVLQHIFEPFFTRRRVGQGTGLGLSITYRIIAEHGGEIEAQSAGRGQGSTFRVQLPLCQTEKEHENRNQAA